MSLTPLTSRLAPSLLLAALAGSALAAPPTLQNLGVLPNGTESRGSAVTPDGSVVTGFSTTPNGYRAFRWTAQSGMQDLGVPSGLSTTAANSISISGNAVAGNASNRLFRWTSSGGPQNLGLLPGGTLGLATGISGDASIVVGFSNSPSSGGLAVRWTASGGVQSLGTLPGGSNGGSGAHAISQDGSIIVGTSSWAGGSNHPFKWTAQSGMQDLGVLPGATFGFATGVSANNAVIVGDCVTPSGSRIFRHINSALQNLGTPQGASDAYARSTNYDGKVVTGRALIAPQTYRACVWNTNNGIIDLKSWLTALGTNTTGWTLTEAWGVSADGSVIAGTGEYNGQTRAFLVRGLPCPSTANLTANPMDQTVCPGSSASFSVAYDAPAQVSIRWNLEVHTQGAVMIHELSGPFFADPVTGLSFEVAGWDAPDLTLSAMRPAPDIDNITVHAVLTNPCGSTVSAPARLAFRSPDLNQDGNADQDDVLTLINAIGGGSADSPIDPDLNRDGNADQDDVVALINWISGGECP
jgi:probable HAF family extracellular repeat protein